MVIDIGCEKGKEVNRRSGYFSFLVRGKSLKLSLIQFNMLSTVLKPFSSHKVEKELFKRKNPKKITWEKNMKIQFKNYVRREKLELLFCIIHGWINWHKIKTFLAFNSKYTSSNRFLVYNNTKQASLKRGRKT